MSSVECSGPGSVGGRGIRFAHDLPRGNFHLCGDGDLGRSIHARRAAARELGSAKTCHDGKFEGVEPDGTLDHLTLTIRLW